MRFLWKLVIFHRQFLRQRRWMITNLFGKVIGNALIYNFFKLLVNVCPVMRRNKQYSSKNVLVKYIRISI